MRIGVKVGPFYAGTSTRRRTRRRGRGGSSAGEVVGLFFVLIIAFWPFYLGQEVNSKYHALVWVLAGLWWLLILFVFLLLRGSKSGRSVASKVNAVAPAYKATGVSSPNEVPQIGKPQKWWPRAGWGTIRNYRAENSGVGHISFVFIPDDGGQPRPFSITSTVPIREMGEYARGIVCGNNITIKVSVQGMAEAEHIFRRINQMELSKRKAMFAARNNIDGDAGWTWMPDYTLKKAAPGLFD
jgi:hypothetical protein